MGAELHFGVVGVQYGHISPADCFRSQTDEVFEAIFLRDIEAAHVAMAGIDAESYRDVQIGGDEMAECCELLEVAAQLSACACRVLE